VAGAVAIKDLDSIHVRPENCAEYNRFCVRLFIFPLTVIISSASRSWTFTFVAAVVVGRLHVGPQSLHTPSCVSQIVFLLLLKVRRRPLLQLGEIAQVCCRCTGASQLQDRLVCGGTSRQHPECSIAPQWRVCVQSNSRIHHFTVG